ncbi:hypothetical protein HKD37_01G001872 [Glycine soja]
MLQYPLGVQNIKFGSKLYVNADIIEIHEFRQSLSVPFYSGGMINDKDGSQSQSSQSNVVEKFLQNAQVVSIGEINNLRQDCDCLTVGTVDEIIIDAPWSYDSCPNYKTTFDPSKGGSACRSCHTSVVDTVPRYKLNVRMEHNGDKGNFLLWDATCIKLFGKTAGECRDELIVAGDDIKVFPTCVDEILLKTWAFRFKCCSQLRQSSVLDVSEELHHIQSLIATLGLKEQSSKGKGITVEPESSPPIFVPTSSDYDPGNSTCLTPTKRISCQQTSSDFDFDEHAQYQLSTNKHIKAENQLLMDIYAERRKRRKTILQERKRQRSTTNDEHQTPTDTTQHDQFIGYDSSDSSDDDANMTQENIDIEYSLNDPTIDDLDDYDEQTFPSASFAYQNTGGTYIDIGDPVWECPHCKAMMWYDERINKDKQTNKPRFSLCCSDGKIQLPLLHEPLHPLNHLLLNNQDPKDKNFQQYIRIYNLMFVFTSPGIKFDKSYNTGKGPPTFRIHGQTHHLIGSLLPMPNNPPKFAQLYIYDTDNEIINRLSQNPMHDMLDEQIIIAIKDMLDHHNHYAQRFRMARDKLHSATVPDLKMKLISQRQTDGRLYNLPTTTEVSALIVGDEHSADKRDIIIEKQSGLLKRIHELHPAYLPLQYPLLYPKGEDGYRLNIPHKDHANIHAAKRKQQWIVDEYCMIESQKLNYVRQHQQQLRVDKYINLTGSNDHPETLGRDKGKRIILPSSFVGGQRYMEQLYFDGIRLTEKETIHLCLTEIENMLQANRRSLRDFPSMPYPIGYARNQHHNNLIHNEMAYDKEMLAEQYNTTYQLLTIYFLYGYGGTGKTFFWTTLSSGIRSNGGIVCTVASSGIASLLLPGGRTAHSKFAIPVPATENSTCNIHQGSELAELLKVTKLIVWDEAPIINMSPSESPWPFKLIRRQFPFIVSYAMTINKSQGQSLHHIGLYFPHQFLVMANYMLYSQGSKAKMDFIFSYMTMMNLLQVPFSYHRQWLRNYPKYVLFHYDGEIHFIRVKTLGTKCFFADGLNDFRRAHNLNESMILRLVAGDKNTIFTVHIDGPAHHHSSLKPIIYRRRYIFTVDITDDMLQQNLPLTLPAAASKFVYGSKKSITIHHRLSKSTKWPLTIQHDIPAITQPWFNLIHEKNLRPGDEVVFYYRFHDHAWELLIRKAIEWNNNNTDLDFDE